MLNQGNWEKARKFVQQCREPSASSSWLESLLGGWSGVFTVDIPPILGEMFVMSACLGLIPVYPLLFFHFSRVHPYFKGSFFSSGIRSYPWAMSWFGVGQAGSVPLEELDETTCALHRNYIWQHCLVLASIFSQLSNRAYGVFEQNNQHSPQHYGAKGSPEDPQSGSVEACPRHNAASGTGIIYQPGIWRGVAWRIWTYLPLRKEMTWSTCVVK